jgi:hypothetical protein
MPFLNIIIPRLMVIYNLHEFRPIWCPTKADSELLVDTDAILTFAIAFQQFQPIPGRRTQEIQCFGGVELGELSRSDLRDTGESPMLAALEQSLRISAAETSDHQRSGYNVYR